jgi:thiol-disulfide isomerase/thioredoxin
MKKIYLLISFLLWLNAFSQTATIRCTFDRLDAKRKLSLSRPLLRTQFPEVNDIEDIAVVKGIFTTTVTIQQPEIMYLTSYVNDSVEFQQPIFLKEGYAIAIDCKVQNGIAKLSITGKGAPDNQPWAFSNTINFNNYPKDTLPDRILADLKNESNKNKEALQNYIATNKPSADFINSWNLELQYIPIKIYNTYSKQRRFIGEAYKRNKKSWDDAFNQLLVNAPLMNETALLSSAYRLFLKMVLIFNAQQFWEEEVADKEKFIKHWYADGRDTGTRSFYSDGDNIPNQKVIEKYFTGKVKEYLYAHLFKMALESGKTANIDSIYTDFSNAYPFSPYKKIYNEPIAAVIESLKRQINKKIIFEPDNIETWAEVLNLFKGKTVLLDMWGTWCGPCREDIKNHGAAIKIHFKNKGLDYLYIANQDETRVNTWKSIITYYNMEGHHVLATKALTNDISENIKLEGYPTYVIIHKDGSFELSKAGVPMDRKILIAQIEEALK